MKSNDWQDKSLFNFWELPKNKNLLPKARQLRKAGVLSEVLFWQMFKDKSLLKWDIDRQVIIGNYIVDFFIAELGLIFEIDGSSHDFKYEYDLKREEYLTGLALKVIHIKDLDVKYSKETVYNYVIQEVEKRFQELSEKKRLTSL